MIEKRLNKGVFRNFEKRRSLKREFVKLFIDVRVSKLNP